MARPDKKMSVHFENPIDIVDTKSDDLEPSIQLKDVSTRKLSSYSYRLSQVVLRRKKTRISESAIVVSAIVFMIVFMLGIVSWLVFSENSTMRLTRTPIDHARPGRQYGGQ